MTERPATPLLDTVDTPADLKRLRPDQLRQLADELRAEMISAVGVTGDPSDNDEACALAGVAAAGLKAKG